MLQNSAILLPLAILVLWSIFMLFWLAGVRVPTMIKLRMHPQKYPRTQDLGAALPANVQWKADNYNHLMEQPTLFYAVVLALFVMGDGTGVNVILAWAYVGARIIHSLIHVTSNAVIHRFRVFIVSTLILLALGVSLLVSVISA